MTNMVQAVCTALMAMAARWLRIGALATLIAGRSASLSLRRVDANGRALAGGLPLVGQQLLDAAVQLRWQPCENVFEIGPRFMPA